MKAECEKRKRKIDKRLKKMEDRRLKRMREHHKSKKVL